MPGSGSRKAIVIRVPEDLHERARIKAVREKTSLQAVLLGALSDWVEDERKGSHGKEAHGQNQGG